MSAQRATVKKKLVIIPYEYVMLLQVLPDFMAGYLLATHGRSFGDAQVNSWNIHLLLGCYKFLYKTNHYLDCCDLFLVILCWHVSLHVLNYSPVLEKSEIRPEKFHTDVAL